MKRQDFCRAKGVEVSTFDYWRARLKRTAAKEPTVVKVAAVRPDAAPITIRVSEHVFVELDGNAGEEQLRRVLKAAAGP